MLPVESKLRKELPRFGPRLWIVPVGFSVVILLGALLLSLPFLKMGQGVVPSFLDTLFVAVSATCVTGLSTFNIGEAYHPFGLGSLPY